MGIRTSAKSESITFRLECSSLKKLQSKAKEERISLNTLVNQIISNYSEWDITATSAGWMVMPKIEVKSIFGKLSDSDIEETAKETADYTKDIRLLMTDGDDFEGFHKLVKLMAKKSGFAYKESNNEREIKLTIQHDLGMKWSLRTKRIYESVLYDLEKKSQIDITPNTVVITAKNH